MTGDVLIDVDSVQGGDRVHWGHVRDRFNEVRINKGERRQRSVSIHCHGHLDVNTNQLSIRSGYELTVLLRIYTAAEIVSCRSQQFQTLHKQTPAQILELPRVRNSIFSGH